ncbi:thioredoxin domain-containing protein 16-like [Actinia tenebrosa]|uniref:Thioredoxin domain-containing protein 16-like n=1 Tax=Actinia tenebrosa TaxID=6105 RepID=A0A6P8IN64_ACTTE|nr:thioredoxin domain-containing protein 16-like [Actinia tenebrosa]
MELDLKFGVVLFLVMLSMLPWQSSAKSLLDLTLDEYNNLSSSKPSSFIAVHFDNKDVRRKFPILLKELRKSSDILQTYGIQIARINCEGISIQPCKEENIYTFRNGVFEETHELEVMFNEDSIVSNLLQTLLKNEVQFISTFENGQRMIQEAKEQKKDLVFSYVKGLGNHDHAIVTKIAFVYAENIMFGLTTDTKLAVKFEGLFTDAGSLAVYMCKDAPQDQDKPCKVVKAKKMSVIYIAKLLQMLRVPKYVYLPDNGTNVYDTLPLSVDKLYIFTDKIEEINENEVKIMADDFAGIGGIIIVDVNKHKDKMDEFGLSAKDSFPTAAYVPASSTKSKPNVELFPKNNFVFSMDNVKFFLNQFLQNPKKEYRIKAESSSLQSITYDQFSKISSPSKTFLFSKSYLLAAFCEKVSINPDCQGFAKHYRRLVRTLDSMEDDDNDSPFYIVHVTLDDGQDVHIGGHELPHVRLYTENNSDDFIVFEGQPDYDELLKFIREKTSIPSITRLPPSNADTIPIDPESKDIKDEEPVEVKDEGQSEEEEEYGVRPEETEDDEVAGAVWYSDLPKVPEDKVPSLTDKTFMSTREQGDLLVVNFFQPWDSRSRALVGPYVQAALSLGKKDIGNFNVRLARVNCFDWTDVCQNNNITTYPTIKFYRKGSDELTYQGALDEDNLVKTVLMLHSSSPLQLDSLDKIDSFLKGEYPRNAKEASETAVVGLFAGADSKEFQVFSEAASELRGSFILGYATGDVAKQASVTYEVKLPAVFLVKRNDPNRPRVVFDQDFSARSIVDFIRMYSLSLFGELTPLNLPLYFKYNRPFLIAFRATAEEDTTLCPVMNQLAQDPTIDPLMLCWMARSSNDVNDAVLEMYTGKTDTPALVLLYHNRGVLYHYKDKMSLEDITAWIKRCLSGEQNPSRFLKSNSWKPLLDGYDYLTMLDEERKRRERKERRQYEEEEDENIEDDVKPDMIEEPTRKAERMRLRKPEDFRDEEEMQKHDEL